MNQTSTRSLKKSERICRQKQIDMLFGGGKSASMTAFPLRVVFLKQDKTEGQKTIQMMVSVPKRHLKHAVDRNRVKRQVREAFRLNKNILSPLAEELAEANLSLAFIWMDKKLYDTKVVETIVKSLLSRVTEKLLQK